MNIAKKKRKKSVLSEKMYLLFLIYEKLSMRESTRLKREILCSQAGFPSMAVLMPIPIQTFRVYRAFYCGCYFFSDLNQVCGIMKTRQLCMLASLLFLIDSKMLSFTAYRPHHCIAQSSPACYRGWTNITLYAWIAIRNPIRAFWLSLN